MFDKIKAWRKRRREWKKFPFAVDKKGDAIGCFSRGYCCDRLPCEFRPIRKD